MDENKKEVETVEEIQQTTEETVENLEEKTEDTVLEDAKLSFTYKNTPEDTGFALSRYFKNFVYKRNWVYTIVFGIIFILYAIELVRNPNNVMIWILAGICLALISWLWLKLNSFKSRTVSAAEVTKDDVYECKVFDDSISIQVIEFTENEEIGERVEDAKPYKINFKSDFVNVENYENMFLLFVNKEMTFIISKTDMDKNTENELVKFFETNCGENYVTFSPDNK